VKVQTFLFFLLCLCVCVLKGFQLCVNSRSKSFFHVCFGEEKMGVWSSVESCEGAMWSFSEGASVWYASGVGQMLSIVQTIVDAAEFVNVSEEEVVNMEERERHVREMYLRVRGSFRELLVVHHHLVCNDTHGMVGQVEFVHSASLGRMDMADVVEGVRRFARVAYDVFYTLQCMYFTYTHPYELRMYLDPTERATEKYDPHLFIFKDYSYWCCALTRSRTVQAALAEVENHLLLWDGDDLCSMQNLRGTANELSRKLCIDCAVGTWVRPSGMSQMEWPTMYLLEVYDTRMSRSSDGRSGVIQFPQTEQFTDLCVARKERRGSAL